MQTYMQQKAMQIRHSRDTIEQSKSRHLHDVAVYTYTEFLLDLAMLKRKGQVLKPLECSQVHR